MDQNQIRTFYDGFSGRLLNDFLMGNHRVIEAIEFSLRNIPIKVENILDIGCGIGWSSYELARHFRRSNILGIDLSNELIQRAGYLFSLPNLSFKGLDVTSELRCLAKNKYDVVVLIDVFEHIQMSVRKKFCQQINEILKPEGQVIMTYPSPVHQEWYRVNDPVKLQPIDNDINFEDLQDFAKWIDGTLLHFEYRSIWSENDYIHAILKKGKVDYAPGKLIHRLGKTNQLSGFQRARLVDKAYPSGSMKFLTQFFIRQFRKIIKISLKGK